MTEGGTGIPYLSGYACDSPLVSELQILENKWRGQRPAISEAHRDFLSQHKAGASRLALSCNARSRGRSNGDCPERQAGIVKEPIQS